MGGVGVVLTDRQGHAQGQGDRTAQVHKPLCQMWVGHGRCVWCAGRGTMLMVKQVLDS